MRDEGVEGGGGGGGGGVEKGGWSGKVEKWRVGVRAGVGECYGGWSHSQSSSK